MDNQVLHVLLSQLNIKNLFLKANKPVQDPSKHTLRNLFTIILYNRVNIYFFLSLFLLFQSKEVHSKK